jgi:hypothetical protein
MVDFWAFSISPASISPCCEGASYQGKEIRLPAGDGGIYQFLQKVLLCLLTATLFTSIAARAAGSSGWTVVPSPNPNNQNILQAVSGISDSDLWVVGVQFDSAYKRAHSG